MFLWAAFYQHSCPESVFKTLYNHNYYLRKEEAIENEPSLAMHKEQDLNAKPSKWKKTNMPQKKAPPSQKQYRVYENVLPTAKTINDFKLNMTIQNETDAALAIKNMKGRGKCNLHFDSTQRSKINGDWPCLILIFSNRQWFSLRSLFAYEDRENIVHLIVETYERLVLTLSVNEEVNIPWELWVKTSDNDWLCKWELNVADGVADALKLQAVPLIM